MKINIILGKIALFNGSNTTTHYTTYSYIPKRIHGKRPTQNVQSIIWLETFCLLQIVEKMAIGVRKSLGPVSTVTVDSSTGEH